MAMVRRAPQRGDVWLCRLDPTVGREIRKARPCLVVSPQILLDRVGTILVVPLTSGSRPAPFRIETQFDGRPGRLVPEQLRSLDRTRFIKRMGSVDVETLAETLSVLREIFED